jgi:membrane protease YdiL (CAAX protease family)
MKKKVITLIISLILISGITYSLHFIKLLDGLYLKRALLICLNLANAGVAIGAMKINGMKVDIDFKNYKQYLIGIGVALLLSLNLVIMPTILGLNMLGQHANFDFLYLFFYFCFYFLIIGPVEELVFRVYVQDTFASFFSKHKWIGVIIAGLIFGLWHIINGSWFQVIFASIIGIVFGLCRHLFKNCKYLGLAFGHGLYDFLNEILRLFLV